MKAYRFYLKRSYKEMTQMEHRFNTSLKFTMISDDMCLILYAWTTDKTLATEFKETRSKDFIVDKIDVTEDLADKLRVEYKMQEIIDGSLFVKNDADGKPVTMSLPITRDEELNINQWGDEHFCMIGDQICASPYCYLKAEYQDELDRLLYTTIHDIFHADSEEEEDNVSDSLSYGLTPRGNDYREAIESMNRFRLFIYIFQELLR